MGATEPLGQAENVIDTFFGTDVDIFGGLRETLETARESLDTEGTDAAFQDFISANNNFYEAVIEALRVIGRDTGQDLQPLIGLISGEQQDTGNQARSGTAEPALGGTSSLSAAYAAAVEAAVSEQEAVEELADFFSFGRDQRDVLAPLEAAVNTAQDALDFIEEDLNATPEDRIAAYTALANAEQALYDQQVSFVENATDITDEVRARVLSVLQSNFNQEIREANDDLVDSLEEIGAELVNVLAFTSGILTGSALAVRQIPLDLAPITDADFTPQDPVTPIERQTGGIEESVVPGTEPNSTALLRNAANRSRFELGRATGEEDFETRRGTLITDINAFYDAELARIAEVEGSEEELQNLREDNQLARDRALDSATNRNNTFAEARIKAEEEQCSRSREWSRIRKPLKPCKMPQQPR